MLVAPSVYFTHVVSIGPDDEPFCKQTWLTRSREECTELLRGLKNLSCPISDTICGTRHTTGLQEAYWKIVVGLFIATPVLLTCLAYGAIGWKVTGKGPVPKSAIYPHCLHFRIDYERWRIGGGS